VKVQLTHDVTDRHFVRYCEVAVSMVGTAFVSTRELSGASRAPHMEDAVVQELDQVRSHSQCHPVLLHL
jgi:hypothetical protein